MNLPIIASKYPPKNRKAVWLQLDDKGGIKSIRKASNNGSFKTLTKTNGITYNEELNSIAIGEGTVANGQDQLVFGRSNVEDANKAEIVGGGGMFKSNHYSIGEEIYTYHPTYVNRVTRTIYVGDSLSELNNTLSLLIDGYQTEILSHEIVQNDELAALTIGYFLYIIVSYGKNTYNMRCTLCAALSEYNGILRPIAETAVIASIDDGEMPSGDMREAAESVLGNRLSIPAKDFISTDYLYLNNVKSSNFSGVHDALPETWDNLTAEEFARKNIRTLDWEGNQWNAGDITCDDGNGNTISLRTLAQQIASLSAATTSNESE